jgi:predicted membrane protein
MLEFHRNFALILAVCTRFNVCSFSKRFAKLKVGNVTLYEWGQEVCLAFKGGM